MKNPFRALFAAILLALIGVIWSGCAVRKPLPPPAPQVAVTAQEALYVALPMVPDSVDSLLARIGWAPGRFAQELRKEVVFQFNHKGIPIVEDSATAKSYLGLVLNEYSEGGGGPSSYAGGALLRTAAGEKQIVFGKVSQRAQAIERSDPTVDNIRLIAEAVVADAMKKPLPKRKREVEYTPTMWMIF